MATAEEVATLLAYEFLRMGRYSASTGPIEIPALQARAAGADEDDAEQFVEKIDEFSGLQVQSVGFEDGPEEPKVHIYLTRGSVREIKALPKEIDDVPVRVFAQTPLVLLQTEVTSISRMDVYAVAHPAAPLLSAGLGR